MKTHIFTPKFIWITFLFILYSNSILAQQISVTGTVIGTDDEPIIGVSILVSRPLKYPFPANSQYING